MTLMNPSKKTDNKLRWAAEIDGVSFKLYVPKRRVPQPWPKRIRVFISEPTTSTGTRPSIEPENSIVAIVDRVGEHSETARFAPVGDPKEWQIGEPYIPYALLPNPSVQRLRVEVEWERSAGAWDE